VYVLYGSFLQICLQSSLDDLSATRESESCMSAESTCCWDGNQHSLSCFPVSNRYVNLTASDVSGIELRHADNKVLVMRLAVIWKAVEITVVSIRMNVRKCTRVKRLCE